MRDRCTLIPVMPTMSARARPLEIELLDALINDGDAVLGGSQCGHQGQTCRRHIGSLAEQRQCVLKSPIRRLERRVDEHDVCHDRPQRDCKSSLKRIATLVEDEITPGRPAKFLGGQRVRHPARAFSMSDWVTGCGGPNGTRINPPTRALAQISVNRDGATASATTVDSRFGRENGRVDAVHGTVC